MDENYQTYLNRAMRLTLPETYQSQTQYIQESPKFRARSSQEREPVPFPGYTIVTPPGSEDTANQALYDSLSHYQQALRDQLGAQLFAPIPVESFHLTLADLIWDSAFHHACENPEFESQLQKQIAQIFQQHQPSTQREPIKFQVLGLMVMTRAIGVCLAPIEEYSYERLLKFRRALYQNRDLIGLGIEQQYYFTPHVTLGYLGEIPPADQLSQLSQSFAELNQQWIDQDPQNFWVHRAELRKFDDMTRYYREPDWAVLEF